MTCSSQNNSSLNALNAEWAVLAVYRLKESPRLQRNEAFDYLSIFQGYILYCLSLDSVVCVTAAKTSLTETVLQVSRWWNHCHLFLLTSSMAIPGNWWFIHFHLYRRPTLFESQSNHRWKENNTVRSCSLKFPESLVFVSPIPLRLMKWQEFKAYCQIAKGSSALLVRYVG